MPVLVVAATAAEVAAIVAALGPGERVGERTLRFAPDATRIDLLTTGVGMVATAAWTARALTARRYDAAFNFGVCGSFDRALPPGQVVHVVSDRLSELGAEDGEAFLTLGELALEAEDLIVNRTPPKIAALERLPQVDGITVNTVHGHERSIDAIVRRCRPQVESMEGAAFMYACAIHRLPFAQVRAVSNVVERRNRAAWKLPEAIGALGRVALEILNTP